MKFRTDFVTNSSSSSFIIGRRKENTYTVEQVYDIIKNLFLKYDKKRKEVINYIDNHSDCPIEYTIKGDYTGFSMKSEYYKLDWDKYFQIQDSYENLFGWNFLSSYFVYDIKELVFNTYDEYLKYWIDKINNEKMKYLDIPFTICDLRKDNEIYSINNLKQTNDGKIDYELVLSLQDLTKDSFIFNWYFDPYDIDKRKRHKLNRKLKRIKHVTNPLHGLLGQICIYSESGRIPDCIVDELMKISEYGCNHMG